MASAFLSKFRITHQDLFSIYASLNGILMLIRTIFEAIPQEIQQYINKVFHGFFKTTRADRMTLVVEKHIEFGNNKVYEAAEAYLRTIINPNINHLKVSQTERQKNLISSITEGQEIVDTYIGIEIHWKYECVELERGSSSTPEFLPSMFNNSTKYYFFEIKFHKKFSDMIYKSYLPYVMTRYDQIRKEEKEVRLYTLSGKGDKYPKGWKSVKFEHPVTFDKLAMEPDQKKMITDDLDRFLKRKEFYQRIGKVWKRGYLLFGPPGTGKTSLIAAMANYLNFDIYDLALSTISSDSDLRDILISTTNRSILIIEDMDCNANVQNQNRSQDVDKPKPDPKLTLSGLLNFFDGLWSSCGDERIIVVTTNNKEMIDPALLRPGRMDIHIHMSYCTSAGFKVLAEKYHGLIDDNPLSDAIQKLLINAKVTPAKVSEELMSSEDPEVALNAVLTLLNQNIAEQQAEESAPMNQVLTMSMIDHQESSSK